MPHSGRKARRGGTCRLTALSCRILTALACYLTLQTGLMPGHIQKLKSMAMHEESAGPSIQVGLVLRLGGLIAA